mgnify:FL=1
MVLAGYACRVISSRYASAIARLCWRNIGSAERPVIAAMAENSAAAAMPRMTMVMTSSIRVIPRCAWAEAR